ncbi:hypothetical protein NE237_001347 [Protea cynaroides]|uniref:Phospho-2-dehydro-3-deoxyheptonate aldolase n=1 Tax=Protea cynaroides TaxID=273540 RepID=A0A9Q0KT58_9MAGN|nr:hypothetical protein NE237_001347 [Protea cynaroides]
MEEACEALARNIGEDKAEVEELKKESAKVWELANRVDEALGFTTAAGLTADLPIMTTTEIWTSHECLLLPYEHSLTREDSTSGHFYDCSAHMIWVRERTRQLDANKDAEHGNTTEERPRHKEDRYESRPGGIDNMDGGSPDDKCIENPPPRKKRYTDTHHSKSKSSKMLFSVIVGDLQCPSQLGCSSAVRRPPKLQIRHAELPLSTLV